MVQRSHLAPVRCGFWRASSLNTQSSSQHSEGTAAESTVQTPMARPEKSPSFSRQSSIGSSPLQRRGSEGRPPKHRPVSGLHAMSPMGPVNFTPDVMLSAVEPFGAQLLELQKLSGFQGQVQYAPTRNRQCHIYVITERPNARSVPLKRVFLRFVASTPLTSSSPAQAQTMHCFQLARVTGDSSGSKHSLCIFPASLSGRRLLWVYMTDTAARP